MKRKFILVVLLLIIFSSLAYAEAQKEYYENGTLKAEYTIEYGKRNGEFKEYYSDGSLQFKGTYKNDEKDGKIYKYDKSGKLIAISEFIDGMWQRQIRMDK